MSGKFDESYTSYQLNRSPLRKVVRKIYLQKAASLLKGPTLDFGCGVGELLSRLPAGSKGVEYNTTSVEFCRNRGLTVEFYDGFADNWSLSTLPTDWKFDSMVISHVLEHLENPMDILKRLLAAATERGVKRVLVIVPGSAGFKIDQTHRTFITIETLQGANLEQTGWRIKEHGHFPLNIRKLGDLFPHHELQCILEPVSRPLV